jgi:adenine/guanine phosphoribosyltransferase-like PRPP-binding protein
MIKHSPYLSGAISDVSTHSGCVQAILRALTRAEREGFEFDAIGCTGVSGLLMGPTIAYLMGKRLAVIRKEKPGFGNHACVKVEHNMMSGDRVLLIDDLVASGATMIAMNDALEELRHGLVYDDCYMAKEVVVEVVGYYLYRDHRLAYGRF